MDDKPESQQHTACRDSGNAGAHRSATDRTAAHNAGHPSTVSPPELVAVAPRSKLRPQRFSNSNELQSFRELRQAYVVGRCALAGVPEQPLTLLYRLPALLQRCEVPLTSGRPPTAARDAGRTPAAFP